MNVYTTPTDQQREDRLTHEDFVLMALGTAQDNDTLWVWLHEIADSIQKTIVLTASGVHSKPISWLDKNGHVTVKVDCVQIVVMPDGNDKVAFTCGPLSWDEHNLTNVTSISSSVRLM